MVHRSSQMPQPPAYWGDDYSGAAPAESGPVQADGESGGLQLAQNTPLTVWPVPGHTELNTRDPSRGQGDGAFGSPRDHGQGQHTGVDITAPVGTPVVASGDGTVANIQPNPSATYGNQVVIEHPNGLYTQYGHLSRIDVSPGTVVHAGDAIGLSGVTGNVPKHRDRSPIADPHLHFEVRRGSMRPHAAGGDVVDPMQYLPGTP